MAQKPEEILARTSLRIDELETRLTFQDDTIASLNEALVMQQQRIDKLEKLVQLVVERVTEVAPELDLPGEEEPPPHY